VKNICREFLIAHGKDLMIYIKELRPRHIKKTTSRKPARPQTALATGKR
jgi:hypothetical protein